MPLNWIYPATSESTPHISLLSVNNGESRAEGELRFHGRFLPVLAAHQNVPNATAFAILHIQEPTREKRQMEVALQSSVGEFTLQWGEFDFVNSVMQGSRLVLEVMLRSGDRVVASTTAEYRVLA